MTTQQNNDAARIVNLKIYGLIGVSAAALVGVGMISDAVNKIVSALPQSTVAGLATSLPVMAVSVCGFSAFGLIGCIGAIAAWRTPRPAQRQQRDDDLIVQSPRPAQIATPTIRQLPAPMPPTEPRFAPYRGDIAAMVQREQQRSQYADDTDNGPENPEIATYSSDYGHPAQQYGDVPQYAPQGPEMAQMGQNERITARLGDGREITINTASWLAFAALTKINRDDWRQQLKASGGIAPNSDFTQCRTIANEYKLLNGQGGWISENLKNRVSDWLINP